jgi:FKBP-type peptidyl-prolyl cis-trans isomerase FkpA
MWLAQNPRLVAILLTTVLAAACGGGDDDSSTPTAPSTPSAPFSQTDLRVGTGTEAVAGRTVRVNYALWLYDPGQSENKGRQIEANQFSFLLGAGRVIRGWDQGLVGMRVGGQRRLVIPPDLAYGPGGNGPIPPNATLVFDIELLDVQ